MKLKELHEKTHDFELERKNKVSEKIAMLKLQYKDKIKEHKFIESDDKQEKNSGALGTTGVTGTTGASGTTGMTGITGMNDSETNNEENMESQN